MNEELAPAPITLPEYKNYADLNRAHQKDVDAGGKIDASGPNEEALYSTQQSQADNSESYRNEMTGANTRGLLESLKSSLKPDPKSDFDEARTTSEFDIRTGKNTDTRESLEKRIPKREERFQDQDTKAQYYKDTINSRDSIADVKLWLSHANDAEKSGRISEDHLPDIQTEASAKILILQDKKAQYYKDTINSRNSISDVKLWLSHANNAEKGGRISEDHLPDIQTEASAKILILQDEKAQYYKDTINSRDSIADVKLWLSHANDAEKSGRISEDHLPDIENIAKNRMLEIQEGI